MNFEVLSAEKYEVEKTKMMIAHATTGVHLVNDAFDWFTRIHRDGAAHARVLVII